ncbi:hypothetical protein Rsub_00924 [Raphidocelis subcapitata]|uniref:VDE lipocalin domain-containing protein n=1 Tax=Raphidocelis subcapitata TaxID=307507 RepID=A0A2V0NNX6_9CHLO|nr:hypothetical protein Rsub_00924 [Raphidocelis subcapitata]|eukprot:GBF88212.1 hypothetical protein Rsub_00924 [Raphidocelis subcapitata]
MLQARPLSSGTRQLNTLRCQRRTVTVAAAKPRQQPGQRRGGGDSEAPPPPKQQQQQQPQPAFRAAQRAAAALCAAAAIALAPLPGAPLGLIDPAVAADAGKVGTCLLSKCQTALARCLADGQCVQNLVCLNLCNGAADETACQIRCGDQYGDAAIDTFNSCAVSEQKCVPQRVDENLFPVPPDSALDPEFDLSGLTGRWFITAGLNPLFDIFDCQEHFFANPEPGHMKAQINWRISKPRGDFQTRSTIQNFVQDETRPGILYNHGNEYLHYEDDWYIIASKPESYVFVYYRGNNDAWRGYGGAVVYTRDRQLPAEIIPELKEAAAKVGRDWKDFVVTDNTCGPHPPPQPLLKEVEADVERVEEAAAMQLRSFGKGFTVLEDRLSSELAAEERELARDLREFERLVEKAEKSAAEKVRQEEALVVEEVESLWSKLTGLLRGGGGS